MESTSLAAGAPGAGCDARALPSCAARLQGWLASVRSTPLHAQCAALLPVLQELRGLGSARVSLEMLAPVGQTWHRISEEIARRYRRDPALAAPDAARFHGDMARTSRSLGEIYAELAQAMASRQEAKPHAEQLALATAHALLHLGKGVKWLSCNHEQPDAGLWRTLHRLLALANREQFVSGPLVLLRDDDTVTSCSQLWLRSVMLTTLNTGNLTPRQVDRAEQWLADWCRRIVIDETYDELQHLYCVDIAGHGGPLRVSADVPMMQPVYLRMTNLYADIVAARPRFLEKAMTSSLGLYERNPLREYVELLDRLQRTWVSATSQALRRANDRKGAPEGTCVEVVPGFSAILALSARPAGAPAAALQWTLRDQSESGIGAVAPQDGKPAPQARQLVALRWKGSSAWQLGLIARVMTLQSQQGHLVGIRLLAREAALLTLERMSATVEFLPSPGAVDPPAASSPPKPLPAFFLPGNERSGLADSLLCPAGTFEPATRLLLRTARNEFVIRMNRVVEASEDWERTGFQILEKRALAAPAAPAVPGAAAGKPQSPRRRAAG